MPKLPSDVKIETEEFVDACILFVQVGTNCPKGGDSGHGGRTVFELSDSASFAWWIEIEGGSEVAEDDERTVVLDQPRRVRLVVEGDAEAHNLLKALEFAAATIRAQMLTAKDIRSEIESRAMVLLRAELVKATRGLVDPKEVRAGLWGEDAIETAARDMIVEAGRRLGGR